MKIQSNISGDSQGGIYSASTESVIKNQSPPNKYVGWAFVCRLDGILYTTCEALPAYSREQCMCRIFSNNNFTHILKKL